MEDKVTKLPISGFQRWKNQFGKLGVPCVVSGRWLQFPETSLGRSIDGEYILLEVMTEGSNDKPRKLCDLFVTKEDLTRAMNSVKRL
jgi:hypothetical protein